MAASRRRAAPAPDTPDRTWLKKLQLLRSFFEGRRYFVPVIVIVIAGAAADLSGFRIHD